MLQDQFVIPLTTHKTTQTITNTAAVVFDNKGGHLIHVEALEGNAWISLKGNAVEEGADSVVIPEGKDKSFTVAVKNSHTGGTGDTISVLSGGKVSISSFG